MLKIFLKKCCKKNLTFSNPGKITGNTLTNIAKTVITIEVHALLRDISTSQL